MEEKLSPKVEAIYNAVISLLIEGKKLEKMKVSDITERAGIGKGTAYEYFKSREEIIAGALVYHREKWSRLLIENMEKHDSFMGKISYLFNLIDTYASEENKNVFARMCYLFVMPERVNENLESCLPPFPLEGHCKDRKEVPAHVLYFWEIIEKGQQSGEVKSEYPKEYVVYSLLGKLMVYLMYFLKTDEESLESCPRKLMKECLLGSVRREFINGGEKLD